MPDSGPLVFGPPLTEVWNVHDFGARGDGVADDTAAINAALGASPCGPVFFPPGTYNTTGGHHITCDGQVIWGTGPGASIINCVNTSAPVFTVNAGLTWTGFREIGIWRNGGFWNGAGGAAAIAGGNGIVYNNSVSNALIQNVVLNNHYAGLVLGHTDISYANNIWIEGCASHGLMFDNTPGGGALQWRLNNMFAQKNGGHGFMVSAAPTQGPCAMGDWNNISAYGNTGFGIAVYGTSAATVSGVRITGGFIGNDAAGELYLDTYSGDHKIIGLYTELTGTGATGRTLSAPATHIGHGITVTANNQDTTLEGVFAMNHSEYGFAISGAETLMTGCRAMNNGIAHTANRSGVAHFGGVLMMSGCRSGYLVVGGDQLYGVSSWDGSRLGVVGCDLRNNTTAAFAYSTNAGLATLAGNMGT